MAAHPFFWACALCCASLAGAAADVGRSHSRGLRTETGALHVNASAWLQTSASGSRDRRPLSPFVDRMTVGITWLVLPCCMLLLLLIVVVLECGMCTKRDPSSARGALHQEDMSGRTVVQVSGAHAHLIDNFISYLKQVSWLIFFMETLIIYLCFVSFFALLYMLDKDAIQVDKPPLCFGDAFFFSVQTFATIGYGKLLPKDGYANALTVVESYVSLVFGAVFGGILFTRVRTATSHLVFADKVVVSACDTPGRPRTLSIRLANETPDICYLNANASVTLSFFDKDENIRKQVPLTLVQKWRSVFRTSWLLTHQLDDTSPLAGLDATNVSSKLLGIIAFVQGTDSGHLNAVYDQRIYYAKDICFGERFVEMEDEKDDSIMLHIEKLNDSIADTPESST